MTALKRHLISLIRETGPMPLHRYMAECLSHRVHGYYMKQDPFGADGDFTTAPEISQMFGELIGLWIGDLWARQGSPENPNLIELGPGRGTLMTDIQRALKKVPGWPEAACTHFVETSPTLKALQQRAHPKAQWHTAFASIRLQGPCYIIANELFDALPIRQFERTSAGWRERYVLADGEHLQLQAPAAGPDVSPLIPQAFQQAKTGSVLEHCAAAEVICQQMSSAVAAHGGAGLIIDYGYSQAALGDSFQAMQAHSYVDPFEAPGDADLTAHVNFQRLQDAAAQGCAVFGPIEQGAFLNALGLNMRAKALGPAAQKQAARLASPEHMGTLFKALAFTPKDSPPPAGFPIS